VIELTKFTFSYECGGKATGTQNFHQAYEKVHNFMRAAMKEIAAEKGSELFTFFLIDRKLILTDTDAHLVKVNEVWDQKDLVGLKVDMTGEGNTVYLDPIPFDKSTSLKKLPELMQNWFQGCLGK
jgi:hypothetical protein